MYLLENFENFIKIGLLAYEKSAIIFPIFRKNLPIAGDRNWRHCNTSKFKISFKFFEKFIMKIWSSGYVRHTQGHRFESHLRQKFRSSRLNKSQNNPFFSKAIHNSVYIANLGKIFCNFILLINLQLLAINSSQ